MRAKTGAVFRLPHLREAKVVASRCDSLEDLCAEGFVTLILGEVQFCRAHVSKRLPNPSTRRGQGQNLRLKHV